MAIAGALAMSIALVGCGGQQKPAETTPTQPQQQTTQTTQDSGKTTEQNSSSSQTQTQAPAQTQTQTQSQTPAPAPAQTAPAAQQISADEAKSIALADADVTAADVRDLKAELDTDDAVVHYDVDFKVGNTEHDYDIDANNGAIIAHKTEVDD